MPEVMFTLKAFMVALVITLLMQAKVGSSTIESHAHTWIETAAIPGYIHEVSSGAVAAIRNAAKVSSEYISQAFGHDTRSQKASRVNLEFKRKADQD